MSLKKVAVSGVKWTSIGALGRAVFQLLQISILTRYLAKEDFGIIAMVMVVIQFTNIFLDLGMTSAILHRQNITQKEYSSLYWLNIFISILLYGLLYVSSPWITVYYKEPLLSSLIPLVGINILFAGLGKQHKTILQKDFRFKRIAITDLISCSCGLMTAVYFAVKDYGIYSLVYSTLMASFLSNLIFFIQNIRMNPIFFYFKFKETKPFLKIGGFTTGSSILDFFSREIDILIIGKLLGAETLGAYSLAKQLVMRLYNLISPVIVNVASPMLSKMQEEKGKVRYYYLRLINILSMINLPVYMLIAVMSKEILFVVYGEQYVDAYLILSFIAMGYGLNTIGNPSGALQIATGRTDLGLIWTVIRLSISSVFIYLSSLHSINSVALCQFLLPVLLTVPAWKIMIKPMADIPLGSYLAQFWKPFVIMVLICILFMSINTNNTTNNGVLIDAIIKGMTSVVFYITCLWVVDKSRVKEQIAYLKYIIKT